MSGDSIRLDVNFVAEDVWYSDESGAGAQARSWHREVLAGRRGDRTQGCLLSELARRG